MRISLEEIFNTYEGKIGTEFYSKILHYDKLVNELDGYWVGINREYNIFANVFSGENIITENNEGYINVFVGDLVGKNQMKINNILSSLSNHCDYLKDNLNSKSLYIQLMFENPADLDLKELKDLDDTFNLSSYVIEKNIMGKSNDTNLDSEFTIRPGRSDDNNAVLDCIEEAYLAGTEYELYSSIGIKRFRKNIREYHQPLFSSNNLIIVAEKDKEFCGHISFDLEDDKFFLDNSYASLIDVFVLDKYKKMGLENALVKAGEIACAKKGKSKIIGTVINNTPESPDKLNNLIRQGWVNNSLVFNKLY